MCFQPPNAYQISIRDTLSILGDRELRKLKPHGRLDSVNDTTPSAASVRLRALQAMSPARRLELALDWSRSVRELIRASIKQANPTLTDAHIHRLVAERLLGAELTAKAYGPPPSHG